MTRGVGFWWNEERLPENGFPGQSPYRHVIDWRPRQDSNLRTRLRRGCPRMGLTSANRADKYFSARVRGGGRGRWTATSSRGAYVLPRGVGKGVVLLDPGPPPGNVTCNAKEVL